mgnify:CR=1 FL=1|jgi:Holliday junction resolvase RusA-like endonuclease
MIEGYMSVKIIKLRINGAPIAASRARITKRGAYLPKKYQQGKEAVVAIIRAELAKQGITEPYHGPVSVSLTFIHSRPKRFPKGQTGRILKCTRPDIDNLAKTYLDASTEAGLWNDDNQVCSLILTDMYADLNEEAHVQMSIRCFELGGRL